MTASIIRIWYRNACDGYSLWMYVHSDGRIITMGKQRMEEAG